MDRTVQLNVIQSVGKREGVTGTISEIEAEFHRSTVAQIADRRGGYIEGSGKGPRRKRRATKLIAGIGITNLIGIEFHIVSVSGGDTIARVITRDVGHTKKFSRTETLNR